MKIYLESGQFGGDYKIVPAQGNGSVYIQSDWDYPGVASSFGWVPCHCGETDGTVPCKHKQPSEMIASAQEYLDDIADSSKCVDDPGYFNQ